jgi:hypothetical protein
VRGVCKPAPLPPHPSYSSAFATGLERGVLDFPGVTVLRPRQRPPNWPYNACATIPMSTEATVHIRLKYLHHQPEPDDKIVSAKETHSSAQSPQQPSPSHQLTGCQTCCPLPRR